MRTPNTPEKFWAKVDKRGDDDCWMWTGSVDPCGYGIFNFMGHKIQRAHCYSHYLATNEISSYPQCVCHRCNVPACVNPSHLYLGTQKENAKDRMKKAHSERVAGFHKPPSLLTDKSIEILVSLRVGDPSTYAQQDRANIERGLALLADVTVKPVVYEEHAE